MAYYDTPDPAAAPNARAAIVRFPAPASIRHGTPEPCRRYAHGVGANVHVVDSCPN